MKIGSTLVGVFYGKLVWHTEEISRVSLWDHFDEANTASRLFNKALRIFSVGFMCGGLR